MIWLSSLLIKSLLTNPGFNTSQALTSLCHCCIYNLISGRRDISACIRHPTPDSLPPSFCRVVVREGRVSFLHIACQRHDWSNFKLVCRDQKKHFPASMLITDIFRHLQDFRNINLGIFMLSSLRVGTVSCWWLKSKVLLDSEDVVHFIWATQIYAV